MKVKEFYESHQTSIEDKLKKMISQLQDYEDRLDSSHQFNKDLVAIGADRPTLQDARDAIISAQDALASVQSLLLK